MIISWVLVDISGLIVLLKSLVCLVLSRCENISFQSCPLILVVIAAQLFDIFKHLGDLESVFVGDSALIFRCLRVEAQLVVLAEHLIQTLADVVGEVLVLHFKYLTVAHHSRQLPCQTFKLVSQFTRLLFSATVLQHKHLQISCLQLHIVCDSCDLSLVRPHLLPKHDVYLLLN